jgi:glutathione S-transferase
MVAPSKLLEVLPEHFGYVIFVAVDSIFVNMWMAKNVADARKKYNIKYPIMYAPNDDNADNKMFNCIQRAHQQTLELHPQFLTLLLIGGLQHPIFATGAGTLYLLGRIVFAKGYYTGDPEKRSKGAFGMIGLLALLGSTLCFAVHQLKLAHPKWLKCCD